VIVLRRSASAALPGTIVRIVTPGLPPRQGITLYRAEDRDWLRPIWAFSPDSKDSA